MELNVVASNLALNLTGGLEQARSLQGWQLQYDVRPVPGQSSVLATGYELHEVAGGVLLWPS